MEVDEIELKFKEVWDELNNIKQWLNLRDDKIQDVENSMKTLDLDVKCINASLKLVDEVLKSIEVLGAELEKLQASSDSLEKEVWDELISIVQWLNLRDDKIQDVENSMKTLDSDVKSINDYFRWKFWATDQWIGGTIYVLNNHLDVIRHRIGNLGQLVGDDFRFLWARLEALGTRVYNMEQAEEVRSMDDLLRVSHEQTIVLQAVDAEDP